MHLRTKEHRDTAAGISRIHKGSGADGCHMSGIEIQFLQIAAVGQGGGANALDRFGNGDTLHFAAGTKGGDTNICHAVQHDDLSDLRTIGHPRHLIAAPTPIHHFSGSAYQEEIALVPDDFIDGSRHVVGGSGGDIPLLHKGLIQTARNAHMILAILVSCRQSHDVNRVTLCTQPLLFTGRFAGGCQDFHPGAIGMPKGIDDTLFHKSAGHAGSGLLTNLGTGGQFALYPCARAMTHSGDQIFLTDSTATGTLMHSITIFGTGRLQDRRSVHMSQGRNLHAGGIVTEGTGFIGIPTQLVTGGFLFFILDNMVTCDRNLAIGGIIAVEARVIGVPTNFRTGGLLLFVEYQVMSHHCHSIGQAAFGTSVHIYTVLLTFDSFPDTQDLFPIMLMGTVGYVATAVHYHVFGIREGGSHIRADFCNIRGNQEQIGAIK